jgi:hypothetical protein
MRGAGMRLASVGNDQGDFAMTGHRTLAAALLLAGMACAPVAAAQQIVATPESVTAELQKRGYKAERIADAKREQIRTSDSGVPITITFYNCSQGKSDCTTVGFYTGFTDVDLTLQQVNDWNAAERWVRTYVDKDGDPVLEMDLDLDFGGLKRELFWDNLATFIGMIGKFRKTFAPAK